MVMYGFKILRFHRIGGNPVVIVEFNRNVPDDIFDKLGIIVGTFRNVFFIGSFQKAI